MAKKDPDDRFHDRREREASYHKQLPTNDEPSLPPPVEPVRAQEKIRRNEPCPCGSGKKYKQCCGRH